LPAEFEIENNSGVKMKALWLLLPVLLILWSGCSAPDNSKSEREKYQQQFESQLAAFDQKLQDARDRSGELSGDAKGKVEDSIADLEQRKESLATKLEEMKAAGGDEWEAYYTSIQEASEDLEQAFGDLQDGLEEAFSEINQ
jgi:predicted  nucleic acid-binding Zn-ribbon protein